MDKQALLNRSEFLQAQVNYFSGALTEVNIILKSMEDQAEEKIIEGSKEAH